MAATPVIRQGGSLPFVFGRNGEDLAGWELVIYVKKYVGDANIFTRVVLPTGTLWTGYLTSAETALLSIPQDGYLLIGQMDNATTLEAQTEVIDFMVTVPSGF